MQSLQRGLDYFSDLLGKISTALMILLLLNVFYDVIARYFFKSSSIGMQELEWHLFASMFLIGIAYTLKEEGHVRVDVIYEKLSPTRQAWINILGCVFLLLPFSALIMWFGYDFALEAFNLGETSGDPGGLSHRWIIKSMIPLSALMLTLSGVGFLLKNILRVNQKED
jgi:TRAP-type mannitol/chloroaromatic compound transport system permease small subunit